MNLSMSDDLEGLRDQIDNFAQLDIFKITTDLTELESSIKAGAFDPRIERDRAVEGGESTTKFTLTNEALNQLMNVTRLDIRDRIDSVVSDPDAEHRRKFTERSEILLRQNITELVRLQSSADEQRTAIAKLREDQSQLNQKITAGIAGDALLKAQQQQKEIENYLQRAERILARDEKAQSGVGRSITSSLSYIQRAGPDALKTDLIAAGVSDPAVLSTLQDMFSQYVQDLKDKPSTLFGEDDPITSMMRSFLELIAGKIPEDMENTSFVSQLDQVVDDRTRKQVQAELGLSPEATDFERGAARSSMFPTVAGFFAEAEPRSPRHSEIQRSMQLISQKINQFVRSASATITEVNNAIQAGSEVADRTQERASELKDVSQRIENLGSEIIDKIDELGGKVEDTEDKDDDEGLRTG